MLITNASTKFTIAVIGNLFNFTFLKIIVINFTHQSNFSQCISTIMILYIVSRNYLVLEKNIFHKTQFLCSEIRH